MFKSWQLMSGLGAVLLALPAFSQEDVLKDRYEDRRDLTLLVRLPNRSETYYHEATMTTFTAPTGWEEIRPQRLTRKLDPRTHTYLGIEKNLDKLKGDRTFVATVWWMQLNPTTRLSEFITDNPISGAYGEEHAILSTVYGRDRVSKPTKSLMGRLGDVYKVNIDGGPNENRYIGSMYIFEAPGERGTRWMVKVRVSYPKKSTPEDERVAAEVIRGFDRLETRPALLNPTIAPKK
ncbi:MAG: hypothetical protein R3B84_05785 [Zavarzinella sp.]